ncbi:permease [Planotetraspora kaengkrachanensis]|uniref:Membrane protein n=1 Tax=Planotetraspora kaengkrachanensis TaxID=575193 RepID=A0A8J3VCU2_9ACTN|nr:permease [Planotetraspora kaengkrachanensis]GIG84809.1 membrane protein [Planotetraspora kaengkrachanensis]
MDWLWHALALAGAMGWEILWALILGFVLSAIVQAVVRRQAVTALLGDDSPRALAAATGLGMASSSCSYAAVALARSLFRKGATFTAAMTFEIASTNLVLELGILLALLLGWQFTLAEFVGGPIMIVLIAVLYRILLRRRLVADALRQSGKGLAGSMEGHAAMDMSMAGGGSFLRRLTSPRGLTSVSHIFVMEWAAIWRDIVVGLLITGALAAWVPMEFWKGFFLTEDPLLSVLWGPVVGPLVAVVSFVCSIGNVPLAAVLWNGGISFGGVVAFIFADLIILPILNIYRKYYGPRMAAFIAGTFFLAMAAAGYLVELIFWALGLTPRERAARVVEAHVAWNYTTWLNICFLVLAAAMVVRFVRTGGVPMLRMMGGRPGDAGEHPRA